MGCFAKNNQVLPLGAENDQPPRAIRHKVKKRKSKKGRNMWNAFTSFFAGLLCVCSPKVKPFKNSVAPSSMYGNDPESSDEEEEEESTTPIPPPPRRGFQEVQLTMAPAVDEGTEGNTGEATPVEAEGVTTEETPAPAPPAKLTVPITELPKPNECNEARDTRTTTEIIQDFRDSGLVGDLVGEKVKRNGLSYEIRIDTVRVRPKTARGVRVPKPPRRLQSLGVEPLVVGEQLEILADKIKEKQEKAALKRQEMKESQLQKQKKKNQKQRKAVRFVANAIDQKKRETAQKVACKAERVKSARLSQLEDRQRKIQMQSQKHQKAVDFVAAAEEQKKKEVEKKIACKAERVKSARECSDLRRTHRAAAKRRHREGVRRRCDWQECPDAEYDKISTYNGSSTNSSRSGSALSNNGIVGSGDESSPLYYNTVASLVPVERNENHDDFFDGPIGEGQEN